MTQKDRQLDQMHANITRSSEWAEYRRLNGITNGAAIQAMVNWLLDDSDPISKEEFLAQTRLVQGTRASRKR